MLCTIVVALGILSLATIVVAGRAESNRPRTYSFFSETDVSNVPTEPDTKAVEVGLRFTSSSNGRLTAVRFLKAMHSGSSHPVNVWSARGQNLAAVTSAGESGSDWQEVKLPKPVPIQAGQAYVVSYHTSRYRATHQFFLSTVTSGPLSASNAAGVYGYGGGGFPTSTWKASNYWVDVVFAPDVRGRPATPASLTAAPPRPPAPMPSPMPSPTGPGADLALPRVPWEGGPGYYANFAAARAAHWTDPTFFPIAVWYEGVYTQRDIDVDKAAGINTYIQLTEGSNLPLVRSNGMYAMTREQLPGHGTETVGWRISDEVDMWGASGSATWTGNWPGQGAICSSPESGCGHDIQRKLAANLPSDDGRLRHANYGKGVIFWESEEEAANFVNNYTSVVSNDIYWYTDPSVCFSRSEGPRLGVTARNCRRAANYGLTMDLMRKYDGMDGKRQPIYNFVEVGHPHKQYDSPTITGDQAAGAAMNSLIHEARGIIYFNHNFGGPCISQHVLRDCGTTTTRPKVAETNARITSLAPVLNTQSYEWTFNQDLDTMLKSYDGSCYIFAMPGRNGGTGTQQLNLPPGLADDRAEVLFEGRSLEVRDGVLRDSFAQEFSYHIYKITP